MLIMSASDLGSESCFLLVVREGNTCQIGVRDAGAANRDSDVTRMIQ